ncbi:hypothetical protein JMJ77_0000326 [Colletotrichum scovillei]|uniref:Uncharacterized protein n=1 Tax=Colletotrichum scovillei TaxID=1209932 RepID=A0A9P7RC16_9PEZI|nr:hypothetical protein JMJ77_0000326 [Colletotrichum scovillei]KAG7071530.1 hypothetical protein JMJ76_0004401 [Colletotrichum scovillei]KAG7079780.1 hypothetical protein JMJ78_0006884 [Colletotrichum scovillei]
MKGRLRCSRQQLPLNNKSKLTISPQLHYCPNRFAENEPLSLPPAEESLLRHLRHVESPARCQSHNLPR